MKARKILAAILAAATVLTIGGCSTNTDNSSNGSSSSPVNSADNSSDQSSVPESNGETLTLKVLTHRTDRIEDG